MKSILEGRPGLAREINKVAEVAGYLWQKGWAERNGGNITINVTEFVDDEIRQMPAISEPKQIGRSEEHTSELQSHLNLVCRLLLEKKDRKSTRLNSSHT